MINRPIPPTIKKVPVPDLTRPVRHLLDNHIHLYESNLGEQDVVKIELVFKAGRWYETQYLIAKTTAHMLKAGTQKNTSEQVAAFFEYYGAQLKIYDGFNNVTTELACLTKHLKQLLPMLYELVTIPAFDEKELSKFIKRNLQNIKVQLQKSDIVAYRLFTEKIFGNEHPYGYNSTPQLYEQVSIDKIKEHFQKQYTANNCTIFVAGKIDDTLIKAINQYFGQLPNSPTVRTPSFPVQIPIKRTVLSERVGDDNLQASLRVGRRTFSRTHPDWNAFYMMNVVLGGYFGARLMQNLRENKGYTYGIYSSMENLYDTGYWYIHTDVATEVKEAALTEIYYEIQRLQEDPVTEEELEMGRNYTLGMLLTSVDGVFQTASVVKDMILTGLPENYFYAFANSITNTTARDVQHMAQKYLKKEDLLEVVIY